MNMSACTLFNEQHRGSNLMRIITWSVWENKMYKRKRSIHQIFSLARDWSKRVTWPNIPQLKLENIRGYSPIFKTARVAKKIWRVINTIAFIWRENMLGYLSLDIIFSSKLTVFLDLRSRKTVRFSEQIMPADKYPSIFSRQMETIVYILTVISHGAFLQGSPGAQGMVGPQGGPGDEVILNCTCNNGKWLTHSISTSENQFCLSECNIETFAHLWAFNFHT